MDILKTLWNDSVWSKVIAAGIIALVGAVWTQIKYKWWNRLLALWSVKLTLMNYTIEYRNWGVGFPLRCLIEVRNDSSKAVEVRLSNYIARNIPAKALPPEVMQVRFNNKWYPPDFGVDKVAVLPGQYCRAWVGLADNFTEAQAIAAKGSIGTLVVSANKKDFHFEL